MTKQTILLSINGTLGKVAIYNEEPVVLGKSACYCTLKPILLPKFVYGLMCSSPFQQFLEDNSSKSTIKNVGLKAIRSYRIICPPIEIQNTFAQKNVKCLPFQVLLYFQRSGENNACRRYPTQADAGPFPISFFVSAEHQSHRKKDIFEIRQGGKVEFQCFFIKICSVGLLYTSRLFVYSKSLFSFLRRFLNCSFLTICRSEPILLTKVFDYFLFFRRSQFVTLKLFRITLPFLRTFGHNTW